MTPTIAQSNAPNTQTQMQTFAVQIGRDARVYYSAIIEAHSLEDAQSKLSRHGYSCPDHITWTCDGSQTFDDVETCSISTPDQKTTLAEYTSSTGWETQK